MKKWSLLVVGLFVSFSLAAQLSMPSPWQDGKDIQPDYNFLKTQIIQNRVTELLVEDYTGSDFEVTDSLNYQYSGVHGHNNYDFIGLTNFLFEPWYDDAEWLEYDGVLWQNFIRMFNTFNEEDLRSEMALEIFDGVVWLDYLKMIYEYDTDGRVISTETQYYAGGVWINNTQNEYVYAEGRLIEMYINIWDGFVWQNSTKNVYTYGPDGILEYATAFYWDGAFWDNDYRQVYYYDDADRLTEKLNQDYGMGWVNIDRLLYTYDGDGFNEQVTRQVWDGVTFTDADRWINEPYEGTLLPAQIIEQYWDGAVWVYDYRFTCKFENYDDGTVAVEEEPSSYAMTIFPNPAHDVVKVSLKGKYFSDGLLQVFDISGQVVAAIDVTVQEGQNLFYLNLKELGVSQGQYIIHLRTDYKIFKGKLTVQ